MSRFLADRYRSLEVYVPGEQPQDKKYVKLNTNESPYPPSEEVVRAVNANEVRDLRLYSDPDCRVLSKRLADAYGVQPENVFLSNGSDDILNFAFMAFCQDGAIFPDISYGFYKVFAELNGVSYRIVPLKDDFSLDPMDYCHAGKAVILANPNAPTGMALSVEQIRMIVETNPEHVVLIDEAYVDFGAESALSLLSDHPNLLIVQTYSKSRSMAGARLGFALAGKELIADLNRLKFSTNPYNINRLTQVAGVSALDSDAYFKDKCKCIVETRGETTDALRSLGFTVLPSKANFVFAASDRIDGGVLYEKLKDKGILIRHFTAERIRNYNRITIGTPEEMHLLLEKIKEILEELS